MTERYQRKLSRSIGLLLMGSCLLLSCKPETDQQSGKENTPPHEQTAPDGKKRLTIRIQADSGLFGKDGLYPTDLSSKTLLVNGLSYTPQRNSASGEWFIDAAASSFGVYSAQMLETGSADWYGSMPTQGILVPSVQFLHKTRDLNAIPLVAEYNAASGDYLDFRPPYAVLDFVASGSEPLASLQVSAATPLSGFVSWKRAENAFACEEGWNTLVLNCAGAETSGRQHYPVLVLSGKVTGAHVRACDIRHRMFEQSLGELTLAPGDVVTVNLNARPQDGLLWFEGFDRCVWGGDPAGGKGGLSPTDRVIDPQGDSELTGYEYARTHVGATTPGSAYVQYSFAEKAYTVAENHSMTDSYIQSRGFDRYKHMLRCRECPGYISAGSGGTGRGVFSLFPLEGITAVKNLDVSFRLCLDPATDDAIQFLSTASSAIIKEWYLDGRRGSSDAVVTRGQSTTLTLDKTLLGSSQWREVRVLVDNCTDATLLQWQGKSAEAGKHAFYLDEIRVLEVQDSWNAGNRIRLLYWNIQNGMWADQFTYDAFVEWV